VLIQSDPIMEQRIQQALDFQWETQRLMHKWRFEGWHPLRVKEHVKARGQLWRAFARGIRTTAHARFMEELHEQLGLEPGQRNSHKPVWLNEQFDLVPTRPGTAVSGADAAKVAGIITAP
jgi:hypothetical protein